MNQKNDLTVVNCIATSLLAFVLTIPMHELFHLLTFYAYGLGDQVTMFSATCVGYDETSAHFENFASFHRIMVAGGSASVLNMIIGLVLFFVLLKSKMGPLMRVFLVQLMGAQFATGFGYFMVVQVLPRCSRLRDDTAHCAVRYWSGRRGVHLLCPELHVVLLR